MIAARKRNSVTASEGTEAGPAQETADVRETPIDVVEEGGLAKKAKLDGTSDSEVVEETEEKPAAESAGKKTEDTGSEDRP